MGCRPTDKHEIDRIDNDGSYSPSNCQWVTKKENRQKTSRIILSMDKAREIRAIYKKGKITQEKLGAEYGVKRTTITAVLLNEIWRED